MYNLLLSINAIWLISIIALLISPQKCLFFIDKTKRKRIPYIFFLLGGYILFFVFASPVIEKTPERIAERQAEAEQKELEEIQQLKGSELTSNEKELNLDIRGAWESIGYYHKTRPYDPDLHKFEIIEFIPSDSLIAEISYSSSGSPQLKSKYRIVGRALIYDVTKEGDNQILLSAKLKKGESNFLHGRGWAYFLYMTSPLSSFQYLWVVILQLRQA